MKKTAIYALTPQGAKLGEHIADQMDGDLFLPARLADSYKGIPFDRFTEVVARHFFSYPCQIFIVAAGIVLRAIAPYLRSKDKDPAVIVLDHEGKYAVSLLSGHLGGANDLAREAARLTGGEAVITTATDTAGLPSMDLLAKEKDLRIANLNGVKLVNMAILMGEPIQVFDPDNRLGLKSEQGVQFGFEWIEKEEQWISGHPGVWVTWRAKEPEPNQLVLHPRCLVAGMGCNMGTDLEEIFDLITMTFNKENLSLQSLKCLATIEAKREEKGLIEAAGRLVVPLFFVKPDDIESIEVPHPSGVVKRHMGVLSVCEATALLKSGGGRLLVPKTKGQNVTLSVALEN